MKNLVVATFTFLIGILSGTDSRGQVVTFSTNAEYYTAINQSTQQILNGYSQAVIVPNWDNLTQYNGLSAYAGYTFLPATTITLDMSYQQTSGVVTAELYGYVGLSISANITYAQYQNAVANRVDLGSVTVTDNAATGFITITGVGAQNAASGLANSQISGLFISYYGIGYYYANPVTINVVAEPSVVPEPSTFAALVLGAVASSGVYLRRRRPALRRPEVAL